MGFNSRFCSNFGRVGRYLRRGLFGINPLQLGNCDKPLKLRRLLNRASIRRLAWLALIATCLGRVGLWFAVAAGPLPACAIGGSVELLIRVQDAKQHDSHQSMNLNEQQLQSENILLQITNFERQNFLFYNIISILFQVRQFLDKDNFSSGRIGKNSKGLQYFEPNMLVKKQNQGFQARLKCSNALLNYQTAYILVLRTCLIA